MTILVDFYVSVLFLEPETHKQTNKNKIESWSLVLLLSVWVFLSGFDLLLIGLVVSGKKKKILCVLLLSKNDPTRIPELTSTEFSFCFIQRCYQFFCCFLTTNQRCLRFFFANWKVFMAMMMRMVNDDGPKTCMKLKPNGFFIFSKFWSVVWSIFLSVFW